MTHAGAPVTELRLYGPSPSEVRAGLDAIPQAAEAAVAEEHDGVVVVRITGTHQHTVDGLRDQVRSRWADALISTQGEGLAAVVVGLLEAADLRVAVAESLTGGLLAHEISEVPGAGARFVGGLVAYANEAKHDVLDVPDGPVVSEQAAKAMTRGVAALLRVPAALSVTGVAGPAEQDGRPVGTVFAASAVGSDVRCRHARVSGEREEIERRAVGVALDLLRRHLLDAAGAVPA